METSNHNVARTSGEVSTLKDQGILAAALHELRDFSPAFIDATEKAPAHVIASCPVCSGEIGSLGALKVQTVDSPPRLDWHCSLHRGGFGGVQYALAKHRGSGVYDLALQKRSTPSAKSYTAPEVDPAADHQKEHICENLRRVLHHLKDLGHLQSVPARCRHCLPCAAWLKAGRISRLTKATSDWASVFSLTVRTRKEHASLTAKLRRHNRERRTEDVLDPVQYVSVPFEGGRTVLTNDSTVAGLYRPIHNVAKEIASLVNRMPDGGRISWSSKTKRDNEMKKKKKADQSRERIGVTKLSSSEISAVCLRFGVPVVRQEQGVRGRGSKPLPTWDVSSLSPDALLGLWEALGVRVTRGVK